MTWTVAGMSEKEYLAGPWWATLKRIPHSHPTILGVADRSEKLDYELLSKKFGQEYQFFLLNNEAVEACAASNVTLRMLGYIEDSELTIRPTVLLRR